MLRSLVGSEMCIRDSPGEVAVGMSYPAGSVTNVDDWAKLESTYTGMFWTGDGKTPDKATIMKMAFLGQEQGLSGKCKTVAELAQNRNQGNRERDPRNCAKLNAVSDERGVRTPYFDGGLATMSKPGRFSFMSTRNHNFSNRNQVGFMCVKQGNEGTCSGGCRATAEAELLRKLKGEKGRLLVEEPKEESRTMRVSDMVAKVRDLLGEEAASHLSQHLED
eukprot:TRINITY_DN552_c0_g1_i1.p1 TRINITY_DN552_c0_g1~~TRINITY_DN552_c0_g1_i1.p1  ORF type:complete len:220 (-),score=70.11 TRINITY_DN552_c0_g1_i1:350-1009(-)